MNDNNDKLLLVLGQDETGKPRAARFPTAQANMVGKAASLMQLAVHTVPAAILGDLIKKVPVGRLYANGRGFVPNIRRDLYVKVAAAAGIQPAPDVNPSPAPAEEPPRGLPASWDDIDTGHLVLAEASGTWWQAIVVGRDGDMLTLKWRGFPQDPVVNAHRASVALLKPHV